MESGQVALGGLVEPASDAPPRLELVDQTLDGVAFLVQIGVLVMGRPPRRPFSFRLAAWSFFSGMTALMPRLRRWARLAREA